MPIEIVSRFIEALERRDLAAAIECIHERVYVDSAPDGAVFSPSEGFREWWDLQISGGSELHPVQIAALDDRRVFATLLSGHPDGEGGWEAETLGFVYTVGDEAIEAIEIFSDPDRALRRARRTPDEVLRGDGLRKDG